VGVLGEIRQKAGERAIRRAAHFNTRKKKIHSFETAKSVGVIFQAATEKEYAIIHDYARELQARKLEVKALGYLEDTVLLNLLMPVITFDFITAKQTNWYGKPTSDKFNEFIDRRFDICLDFSSTDCIPAKFAAAASMASFKVGMFTTKRLMIYDLMLEMKNESDLDKIIKEADHYIKIIKPA
jgi:hypothetical protein